MSILDALRWNSVRSHYDQRYGVHQQLLQLHENTQTAKFADLALGVSDDSGNYSAVEHGLGPKIIGLNPNAAARVFSLAGEFKALSKARTVPELIKKARISYLQIGVGSEISCMINPSVCWVANTRTIWTHLVVKHADNTGKADEELRLYRDNDVTSEMAYQIWSAIHAELDVALTRVAEIGKDSARKAGVRPGEITYLWADAIASSLYERYH